MTEDVALYSSHAITRQELEEVILEGGGMITPKERFLVGLISQEKRHIWIALDEQEAFLVTWDVLQEDEPGGVALVRAKLGAEPRSCIGIEISRTPSSQRLAVDFAYLCATKWPCVAVGGDEEVEVFTKEDLLQMQKEGRGIIRYGT